MEHLSNDHEDHPNQHENGHKLCDETGHPIIEQILTNVRRKKEIQKSRIMRSLKFK